jgi:hypothetical protein
MDAIRAESKKAIETELFVHDIRMEELRPFKGKHSIPWLQWFDELLQSVGIDLLRD